MSQSLVTARVSAGAYRRGLRNTAIVAGVAAAIAAGGFAATHTFGPDAHDPPVINYPAPPADRVLDELRASVAGQYGSRRGDAVRPSVRDLKELQRSVAGQYGSER